MPRFAAIGLDHRHIYDLTQDLLDAGAECVGYNPDTTDPRVLAGFRKRFPHVPASETKRLLEDPSIDFVVIAARPCDRAELAIAAMRCGKDVMVDKPGVTTSRAACRGRARRAGNRAHLVDLPWPASLARGAGGAAHRPFGRTWAAGAHDVARAAPAEPRRCGRRGSSMHRRMAASSTISACTRSISSSRSPTTDDAEIVSCSIGAFGTEPPGFEDFAELVLATPSVRGYVRLDWFTPDGLPTWGDGRFFVVGTEGTLELRKNLDIEGREGTDHMFVANRTTTRYVDCSGLPVTYYRNFLSDIANRSETAMPKQQVFNVCRLALRAQEQALRYVANQR